MPVMAFIISNRVYLKISVRKAGESPYLFVGREISRYSSLETKPVKVKEQAEIFEGLFVLELCRKNLIMDCPSTQSISESSPNYTLLERVSTGVLLVEPYKSEILPHWRFKTACACSGISA
jgi:hypothetical protein